jgi:chloride channel protein, CIC family
MPQIRDEIIGRLQIKSNYYIYFYSVVVGVLSGLATILFVFLLNTAEVFLRSLHNRSYDDYHTLYEKLQLLDDNVLRTLLLIFLPALGALISGVITFYFADGQGGTGADQTIRAFHRKEGKLIPQNHFIKAIGTIFTLSSGGSGGKEGPAAQVGGGIGVFVADFLKAGARARRTLLLAGTAAGLGAVFKAPLGGALTAVEMVYKEDIESDALIPCFISSVTAYLVYTTYAGTEPFMTVGAVSFEHLYEIIFYLVLGGFCFLFGFLFIKIFNDSRFVFGRKLNIHPVLKPAIGGFLVGCISLLFYEVTGGGTTFLNNSFAGNEPSFFKPSNSYFIAFSFLLIAFMKIVATALTIGSGGSAGIFGPSLFIGGMIGAAVGNIAHLLLPDLEINITSFMFVGMGAFYAGVANAPLAGIIMICEMTGTYVLLVPLIIVSIFTFIMSKKISYYRSQVKNRFNSPAHYYDMNVDVIESVVINDIFSSFSRLAIAKNTILLKQLRKLSLSHHASDFIITDELDKYLGIFSFRQVDLGNVPYSDEHSTISHLVNTEIPALEADQTLGAALSIILKFDVDKVAIVSRDKVLGYISMKDIFNYYLKVVKSNIVQEIEK